MKTTIQLFSDGGSRGNGSREALSGWGTYLKYGEHELKLCGGDIGKTNNQMELTGLVEGLKRLKSYDICVEVFSDSAYLVDAFNKGWIKNWENNGWRTSKKESVENQDLWKELIALTRKFSNIQFFRVKGHVVKKVEDLDNPTSTVLKQLKENYDKFIHQNQKFITMEEFIEYIRGNVVADSLVNQGMDKI